MEQYPLPEQDYKVLVRCYTFNHEKYIEDALRGFVMQKTNFPFVAVIVDDASTDGTADIIRRYETEYPDIIKGIYLKENHYSQKKKKAPYVQPWRERCKYEAICEGDDYWNDPLKLQKQVDFLEAHEEYVLSYCNRYVVNHLGRKVITNQLAGKSGNLFEYLLFKGNPITTASVLYKIESFKKANQIIGNQNLKNLSMGDYPLWIVLSNLGKFHYLNEKMITYRVLENSASHASHDYKKIEKFGQDELLIKKHYYKLFTNKTADSFFEKKYYEILIRKMAKYDYDIFIKYFKEGIKHFPSLAISPKLLCVLFLKISQHPKMTY